MTPGLGWRTRTLIRLEIPTKIGTSRTISNRISISLKSKRTWIPICSLSKLRRYCIRPGLIQFISEPSGRASSKYQHIPGKGADQNDGNELMTNRD